jgi:phosphatidylserine/phosphatidylglycerophosphate/cardiolipin synthase-like enzyme/uncharacterized membrane protein YdjX (TVP38/TMEM64 family)
VFEVGRTCAQVARATRAALLIDTAAYFTALRASALRAEQSLIIIGWDVDSRVRIADDDQPLDGYPARLLDFLLALLEQKPALHIYISAWDFSLIYALEREFLPTHKFANVHPRLHYRLQARHPGGASHHEKLVVVDERVAFVGGMDLTIRRWDTPAHVIDDPRRVDPAGEPYAPIHDIQLCVDGPLASALSELARSRVERGMHESLPQVSARSDPWPPDLAPDFRDVDAAIARTLASVSDDQPDLKQCLAMTLAAIASARHLIFIENQYLTAASVVEALVERLQEPEGPELVVILPREECGWLERNVMGRLRADALHVLTSHDSYGRLGLYYPTLPGLELGCVNVHSKLLLVDNRLLKVGSSNLSNRSMGLDSECDVWIEAGPEDHAAHSAIERTLLLLLSEHLDCEVEALRAELARAPSVLHAIEALRGRGRTLVPLPIEESPGRSSFQRLVLDPEQPPAAEALVRYLMPAEPKRPRRRALLAGLTIGLSLLAWGLLLALRDDPHSGLSTLLDALLTRMRDEQLGLFYVLGAYALGALLFVPITLLLIATSLAIPPWPGFLYCMLGALSSACLGYALGRVVGSGPLRRLGGSRLRRVRARAAARSLQSVVLARLLPVGNFSLINLFMGSLPVPFRAFVVGNLLGLLPGVLGLTVCADQLARVVRSPSLPSIGRLILLLVGFCSLTFGLSRLITRRQRARAELASAQHARRSLVP